MLTNRCLGFLPSTTTKLHVFVLHFHHHTHLSTRTFLSPFTNQFLLPSHLIISKCILIIEETRCGYYASVLGTYFEPGIALFVSTRTLRFYFHKTTIFLCIDQGGFDCLSSFFFSSLLFFFFYYFFG